MGLEEGARQAMHVCLGLKKGERVAVVADMDTLDIGKALEAAAREKSKDVKLFILEDFGERPLSKVPEEIEEEFKRAAVTIVVLQKMGNEVHTIRKPLRILGLNHGRHANMPGVKKSVFESGMKTDHTKVWKFSGKVASMLKDSKEIRVTAENGTDLKLTFTPMHRWVDSNGDMREKGHLGTNLPGAEVYTCPDTAEGIYVVDVEMGDYFTEKYGFLDKNPVKLTIEKGRVVKIECENQVLAEELQKHFKSDEHADRVSEFALGTNPFLKDFVGVFIQDEKVPGVHIAIGNPYPEMTGAGYSSKIHVDCITRDPTVWVDGKKILGKGEYLETET